MKNYGVRIFCIILIILSTINIFMIIKNEDETSDIDVTSLALKPIEKVNASSYTKTRISSSSGAILKIIADKVPNDIWLPYDDRKNMNSVEANAELLKRKSLHQMLGGYYIEIPNTYFQSTMTSCYKGVQEFNFSGQDLGKVTLLPDFSKWPNLKRLNFSKCNITDVSGFTKSSYLKNVTYIDLGYNRISDLSTGIVKDSRFNLKNQEIPIKLGSVQKGTKLVKTLPPIFTKSYADFRPPSKLNGLPSKITNGNQITFDTSIADTNIIKVISIDDSNSRFNGSKVFYEYVVLPVGTSNKNEDNKNNNNNNSYKPVIQMTLNANSNSPGGYAKSKNITITLTGNANVNVANANIYVNGKKVTNNNGKAVYNATKNGTYNIKVTYSGLNDIILIHKVDGIDSEKPSYTYSTTMNIGSNIKNLVITAKDNCAIKSISINGNNLYKCDNKTLYCQKNINYKITKSGNYKIRVEDIAGNVYEKTENITIDTRFPQFNNVTVIRETKIGFIGNTEESKNCKAKVGDTITVTMKADEDIGGFEDIYLNGKIYGKSNSTVEKNKLTLKIHLTQDIVDSYGLNGYVNIEIRNVIDMWGNEGSYSNNRLLYLDKKTPQIKQVLITGGTFSQDKKAIEIYKAQEINISIIVDKRLANKPSIKIGADSIIKYASFEKDVIFNGQNCSQYSVTIKTNSLVKGFKSNKLENCYIPILISGYYDTAGNMGEVLRIDENNKSSNGVCLVYGKVNTGRVYFSGIEKVNDSVLGDINGDSYINDYDYLLLMRHLSEIEELSDEQKKYANIDGIDSIDKKDLVELNNLIEKQQNELFKNKEVTFKIYDESNKQLTGDNLKFTIEEGEDLITITNTQDTITLKAKEESGTVVVKASYTKESGYEEQIGTMRFKIGTLVRGSGIFEVISENRNKRNIIGDINKDGFVTILDSRLIQEYLVDLIKFTDEQIELADVVDDEIINIFDATAIKKMNYFNYNGMKAGDRIKLKFNTSYRNSFEDFKDSSIENQIEWSTKESTDMVTIIPDYEEGSAEIVINNNAKSESRITIVCKARISENEEEIAEFNIEIMDKAEIDLTNKEIEYNLSNLEENNILIKATTNLSNREILWQSSDENVARVQIDEYGNAEVVPLKPGKAIVSAIVDGVKEECVVTVKQTIKTIRVDNSMIYIKETEEAEVKVNVNPTTATERPIMISEDEDIAKVYEDKETGTYKVLGVREGTTKIIVSSPSNSEINSTIEVNVKKLIAPSLKSITIEQEEEEKVYSTGEEIFIKFVFTDVLKGDAPKLNLQFGNYANTGNAEFIEFQDNNTAILYKYTIKEGDNGTLLIKNLEGGSLTDETGKIQVILDIKSNYYKGDEIEQINEQEEGNLLEVTSSNEEENIKIGTSNIKTTNYLKNILLVNQATALIEETSDQEEDLIIEEFVADGIHQYVSAVGTDTEKPTIKIEANVDKNSCWLKEGDIAKVKIIASEELKGTPILTMGGIEATVEGSGTEYTASLPVTKELEEGYLEIKVRGYQDLAGNEGEEVIAQEENIDEPIIIDYSGTKIKSIELIKEEGKKYDVGDQFKIRVVFKDATIDRNEYITSSEMPKINIKFGQNEAQGKLESDYKSDEYEDSIIYTYTISEKDDGKISINGLLGIIQDIAGNITVLDNLEELPEVTTTYIKDTSEDNSQPEGEENKDSDGKEENKTEEKNEQENNKADNKEDKKYFGKLPYAGASSLMIGLVTSVMAGIIVVYVVKKKHLRIRIKFK